MSRRALELQRIARALDRERPEREVRRRVSNAIRSAATSGGKIEDHLLLGMTPEDLAERDYRLRRAREALPEMDETKRLRTLTDCAKEVEHDVIAGRLDIDRPAAWPPMPEFEEHLAHMLRFGPMISRSRYYEVIVSGDEPDRTVRNHDINLNEVMRKWKAPTPHRK